MPTGTPAPPRSVSANALPISTSALAMVSPAASPPVLAKPIGGSEVAPASARAPAEPSKPMEGTNDPSEGSVALEAAEAESPEAKPTDAEAAAPPTESEATPK